MSSTVMNMAAHTSASAFQRRGSGASCLMRPRLSNPCGSAAGAELQQPVLHGQRDRMSAVLRAELHVQMAEVRLHRELGDPALLRDVAVGQAARDELEDGQLPGGQCRSGGLLLDLLRRLLGDEGETVAAPAGGVALEPLDVLVVATEDLCAGDRVQIVRPPKSVTA